MNTVKSMSLVIRLADNLLLINDTMIVKYKGVYRKADNSIYLSKKEWESLWNFLVAEHKAKNNEAQKAVNDLLDELGLEKE